MIIPSSSFTCSGRITRIRASSSQHSDNDQDVFYQIWHPSSPGSNIYNRIGQVMLEDAHATRIQSSDGNYYMIDITLNGNDKIEFEHGDVFGHFEPAPDPRFRLWSITTSGYTTYSNSATSPSNTFDISSAEFTSPNQQPMIQISFGMKFYIQK